MSPRRAIPVAAVSLVLAGSGAAWTLMPARAHADTPRIEQPVQVDPWAKGPVDRGNMVQGVLDYRSAPARR